jgi:hypothetical protein
MRIAKPLLLILTPIGVAGGLFEAYRFGGGGLMFLMLALLTIISAALGTVVYTIRKERRVENEALKQKG